MAQLVKVAVSCALFLLILGGCTAVTPATNQGAEGALDKTTDMQPQRGGTFRLMQAEHVS